MTTIVLIILFILFLLGSAFFSGSETALFSLSRARLLAWKDDDLISRRRSALLMGTTYNKTLIALILGNMFVNSGLTMTNDELMGMLKMRPEIATVISVIISIILLLLIGEVTPKTFALMYAESISERVSGFIFYMRKFFAPVIFIIEKIFSIILDLLGRKENLPLDHDEYSSYLDMAYSVGAFSGEETRLLTNILSLRELSVNAVMRARIDIRCVKKGMTPRRISNRMQKAQEQYYPVVSKDIDDAEHFISARDFYLLPEEKREDWQELATFPAVFIPENTSLTKGLALMKKNKVPVALVADEYGGITGMLKLKDIYEELIGDVNAEFENPDWQVRKLSAKSWLLNGNIPIQDIEELTNIDLEDISANTLNGLFCEIRDKIPAPGDSVVYKKIKIKAKKVDNNRIIEAELRL